MNKEKEIKDILLEITELLETVDSECHWISILKRLYADHFSPWEYWLGEIRSLYGGMGSFTDLILRKNGVICEEENKKLDLLRGKLYESMTEGLAELRNLRKESR